MTVKNYSVNYLSVVLLMGAGAVAPPACADETSKKVRVYTDATTYSYRATSVDWKAEKITASRIYYSAMLVRFHNYSNSGAQWGNFTIATPLKRFSLSEVAHIG